MSGEPSVRLGLWRDGDPAAMRVPGMYVGEVDVVGDPLDAVARVAADGVRFVRVDGVVDLAEVGDDGRAAVAGLVVVRELTSHGIGVDWTLRAPAGGWDWRALGHLYPPTAVVGDGGDGHDGRGDGGAASAWRAGFLPAKCGYRHGPGFIEVRDQRGGSLRRLVIRNPRYDQVISPLLRGVAVTDLAEAVTERYRAAGLLHRVGSFVWWTPYRVRGGLPRGA
ncbi:DUF5825 family protein [Embleya sp. AB8]|uniref:DUF5825 family protein n=1 Tax=Embleya sp. AB8 TaxID=3156304 RepID=UPI003C7068D6